MDNREMRPWDAYTWCDGLFLMFDTAAHVSEGRPVVPANEVQEHVSECADCQAAGVSVDVQPDGSYFVQH